MCISPDCNKVNPFKQSNHAPKKMPNWGMNAKSSGAKKSSNTSNVYGSFGKPAVRMSFGSRNKGY